MVRSMLCCSLRPCGSAALKMEPTSAEMKDDLRNELLHQAAKPSGGRTSKGLMFLNCNQWSCATPSHPRVQTGVHTGTNTHAQTERDRDCGTPLFEMYCVGDNGTRRTDCLYPANLKQNDC